jgi:hypothetical protein
MGMLVVVDLLRPCFGLGSPPGCDVACGGDGDDTSGLSIGIEVVAAYEPARSVTASLPRVFAMSNSTVLVDVARARGRLLPFQNCSEGSSGVEVDFNVSRRSYQRAIPFVKP